MSKRREKPSVMFSTNGDGKWWRTEWPVQCPVEVLLGFGRCQAAAGHEGDHWCYNAAGWLCREHNKSEGKLHPHSIAAQQTPPGHKLYVDPLVMSRRHYSAGRKTTRLTDPKEIARIEAGKIRAGESVNQPLTNGLNSRERRKLSAIARRALASGAGKGAKA